MDCSIRTSSDVLMFSSTIVVPSSTYYSSKSNNSNINVDVDDSKTKESVNTDVNPNSNNNNAAFDAFPQSGNV